MEAVPDGLVTGRLHPVMGMSHTKRAAGTRLIKRGSRRSSTHHVWLSEHVSRRTTSTTRTITATALHHYAGLNLTPA